MRIFKKSCLILIDSSFQLRLLTVLCNELCYANVMVCSCNEAFLSDFSGDIPLLLSQGTDLKGIVYRFCGSIRQVSTLIPYRLSLRHVRPQDVCSNSWTAFMLIAFCR